MGETKRPAAISKDGAKTRFDSLLGERRAFFADKDYKSLEQWMIMVEEILEYLYQNK